MLKVGRFLKADEADLIIFDTLLMFCENMRHFRAKYTKNMLKTLNYSLE